MTKYSKACLALGLVLTAHSAKAISYDVNVNGTTAPAGSHFTPTGGSLEIKNHNGFNGLGVSGGYSGAEIDLDQKLTITFDQPQILQDLTLAFLYDGPEYSDGNELADIKINGVEYVFTATGSTTATWTGSGSWLNVSPADDAGGAVWKLINPAGNVGVTSIELYPMPYPQGHEAPNPADFSLNAFNTTSAPDAGASALLLALGTLGLAAFKRIV